MLRWSDPMRASLSLVRLAFSYRWSYISEEERRDFLCTEITDVDFHSEGPILGHFSISGSCILTVISLHLLISHVHWISSSFLELSYILLYWSRFRSSKIRGSLWVINFFSLSMDLMIPIFLNRNEDVPLTITRKGEPSCFSPFNY